MKDRRSRAKMALAKRRKKLDAAKHDWLRAADARGANVLRCTGEPLSLRASDNAEVTTATFDAVAYSGGVMTPNLAIPWKGPVVVDLAGMGPITGSIPIHRDHDEKRPVAHTTSVDNDRRQLACSGVFSIDSDDTEEVLSGARKNFPWRPSVGLQMLETRQVPSGQRIVVNGREFVGPILWVTRSRLKEISFVTIPGDADSYATIAASQGSDSMTFEQWLASLGLDPATLTPEAMAVLQTQYDASQATAGDGSESDEPATAAASAPAEQPTPAASAMDGTKPEEKAMASSNAVDLKATSAIDPNALQASIRKTIADEHARSSAVRDLCASFGNPKTMIGGKSVDLCAHAIENGWTTDQTELHARRHQDLQAARDSRPSGIAIHSTSRSDRNSLQAIQGGLLLRAGCNLDSPSFANPNVRNRLPAWLQANVNDPVRARAMDNAQALRNVSLIDACRMGLQASGHDVPHDRLDVLQASFSTGTMALMFGTTIGAKMLDAYAEVKDFSEGWCREGENPDMEQHNRVTVESAQNLAYHPSGGTAPHTGRTATAEKSQVFRFTRQMSIDEADFLSDNFGKFKDTPRDFGLAAGRVRPDMVAALLLSNPTLLKTARALFNGTDGTTATSVALARATVSSMIAAIAKRKSGDASLNLATTHLIVPPDLFDLAVQLTQSGLISNDSGAGEMNPLKQYGLKPVSEPRLSNGMTHPITGAALAGSAVTYYGVSAEANTIEVTYLAGAGRVPVVRTTNLTNGEFGINVDVRHYIGAVALDHLGFYRGVG
jgi:hypothetical protein